MSTDLVDAIIAADVYEAQTWRPNKPGDLVAGKVIYIDFIETKNGQKLLIKMLCEKVISDGEELPRGIFSVWERAAIRQVAEEQRIRVGDEVAFRFVGEVPTNRGGTKKQFAAIVQRTDESEEFTLPVMARPPVGADGLPDADSFKDDIPI